MAIDPKVATETAPVSPIENEIAAYRAISPMAVFSLILGLVAGLSFADPTFLAAGALAVVVGILADRKIKRMPDVLTGRGLAQAGIALGVIFSLASVTSTFVRGMMLKREATAFAKSYAPILGSTDLAKAVFYKMPASERGKNDPDEALRQMRTNTPDLSMYEMQTETIRRIQDRIKRGGHLEFNEVEKADFDGLTPWAIATYHLHTPGEKPGEAEKEEMVGVELKADHQMRGDRWVVTEVIHPYIPKSISTAPARPKSGDGHGHSH